MTTFLKFIAIANLFNFSVAFQPTAKSFKIDFFYLKPPVAAAVLGEVVQTKWIQQKLNNFDSNDVRTWQMRYMENNFYLKESGTIFIFVGGEIEIDEGWLLGGYMRDMAIKLKGTMFYVEHRYYGQSHPTADLSSENLRFLSVDQALADLARFIALIKETNVLLTNSPVILVGASYAAALTTWFMQEYPDLAQGAWVSSAPLNAKVDFFEYREVVSKSIEIAGGINCSQRIYRAFNELKKLITENELTRVEKLFNLCYPLNFSNQLDLSIFISGITNSFAHIVQWHRESNEDIQKMCSAINDSGIDEDIDALSHWWLTQNDNCFNHLYVNYVRVFNQSTWNDNQFSFGIRQWTYQTCSEFGWFQSTNLNNSIFGPISIDVEMSLQLCIDFFGPNFSSANILRNIDMTNIIYRGRNPDVRNVYSTHGEFDPWHTMGVQNDINLNSPTIILPREAHCSDLYSISSTDSPALKASKKRIFELIQQWIRS